MRPTTMPRLLVVLIAMLAASSSMPRASGAPFRIAISSDDAEEPAVMPDTLHSLTRLGWELHKL